MQILFSQLQPHVYSVDIIDYSDIILQSALHFQCGNGRIRFIGGDEDQKE